MQIVASLCHNQTFANGTSDISCVVSMTFVWMECLAPDWMGDKFSTKDSPPMRVYVWMRIPHAGIAQMQILLPHATIHVGVHAKCLIQSHTGMCAQTLTKFSNKEFLKNIVRCFPVVSRGRRDVTKLTGTFCKHLVVEVPKACGVIYLYIYSSF